MGRPSEIKNRRTINVVADGDIVDELLQYIGKDNFSKFLREQMKDELMKFRKKVEAPKELINPLGLPTTHNVSILDNYITIDKLCESFEENIIENIDKEKDTGLIYRGTELLNRVIKRMNNRKQMLFKEGEYFVNGKLFNKQRIEVKKW